MNLNQRIENTKPYFLQFNVLAEEDAIYAVAKFPQGWQIPDKAALKNTYKVELAPMQNGMCFVTETKNGPDCVFDALEYVIKFNKCAEERKELLVAKINELKNLFVTEDIEKLKTLTFTFEKKKNKQGKKSVAETKDSTDQQTTEETTVEQPADDTSLMALAKNLVED